MADPALPMSGSFQLPTAGPQPAAPLQRRPSPLAHTQNARWPDQLFRYAMWACAASVLVILVLIVYELVLNSRLSWNAFGFKFFGGQEWDPVQDHFGALPFIYGTLVSSLLALLIAVPLSIGTAVFLTVKCPAWLLAPPSFFTALFAAFPNV